MLLLMPYIIYTESSHFETGIHDIQFQSTPHGENNHTMELHITMGFLKAEALFEILLTVSTCEATTSSVDIYLHGV